MLSFYSIEISHSIALCEPFPLYILLLYQIIVHSISLFCYISFFTFILIRIYLQWSSYPISIGHPSVIFTQMKFLPLLFNSFGTVFCCTIFWICFCGNFFFGNYNIFDLQQLILTIVYFLFKVSVHRLCYENSVNNNSFIHTKITTCIELTT